MIDEMFFYLLFYFVLWLIVVAVTEVRAAPRRRSIIETQEWNDREEAEWEAGADRRRAMQANRMMPRHDHLFINRKA